MPVKVRIPTPLRQLTNGVDIVELQSGTVDSLLAELSVKFAGMDKRLFKQPGELNRFVNIYVNDEDVRFSGGLDTAITDGDSVTILPAVAGG
jgi:molybdopterin synthase sulfur carrier subunit